jgi:rhodanese-related sulfurtransferase
MANKKQTGNISKRMQKRAEERRKKRRNLLLIGGAVAVLIIAAVAALVWGKPSATPAETSVALPLEVQVEEAYQMVQDGAFLLDVREQSEWDDYHAPQATLIPLGELASRVDELPRDRDIVVICNSGNRSQEGRDILLDAGFERVTSSAGGIIAWAKAGYPTE